MQSVILVAETGSDITPELAAKYNIYLVPMHVSFGSITLDDGTFPPRQVCDHYLQTGKLPKTSGSTPEDFARVFDLIHQSHPDSHILYLAYSSVTTCSYPSACVAAEGRDYVTLMDTRQVSIGQGAVVTAVAQHLTHNPRLPVWQITEIAEDLIARARMCFLPDDLEFLRAGGRVSNAACLGSRILSLHPCIEVLEGRLMATRKYRGKMEKVAAQMICDYAAQYSLQRDTLWMVYTPGLSDPVREAAKEAAVRCGFASVRWIPAGGVITTHGGPAAFGIAGFSEK